MRKMDLANINFDENADKISNKVRVKNSYPTDEQQKIWNYFIGTDKKNININSIIFDDGVKLGVIDDIIVGYKGTINQTKKSKKLLTYLRNQYAKARILTSHGEDDKVLTWTHGNIIVHYLSCKVIFGEDHNRKEISTKLTVVRKQALKKGLWPYSQGLLQFAN